MFWRAMLLNGLLQPGQHVLRAQGTIHPQHMTLAGVFVKNRQYSQTAATHRRVRDEVPRPYMTPMRGRRRQTRRNSAPDHLSFGGRDAQPFRPAQSLNVPFTDTPALLAQHRGNPPIPVSWMFEREFMQPFL
jgi:hypothetical protein